ncbi:MAG: MFS transporter, partial [Clostridiales bacterium]|nr:MFS transporter [Clostridiales bacterium]
MNGTHKIKLGEKLGFMTFSGSNNIIYQFKNLYYLFFLTNVLKIDIALAGSIITIGTIWDAVNDPLIGYWSVNRRFKNGEAVRPFALWHCVPWAIVLVAMFTDFGVSEAPTAIIALVAYILFEVFNTTCGLPYNAMAGLATASDPDRRSINVFRNLGGCIGSAIGAVSCLPLLKLFGALDASGNLSESGASGGFIIVAAIFGGLVVGGSLTHYFTTKERVKQISEDSEKLSFLTILKLLAKTPSWWYNTLFIICYMLVNMLLMTSLTYYATYVLGSTASATMIQAVYLVMSVATSFLIGPLDKKLGRRKAMMTGAVIAVLGKIWFIIDPFSIGAIYVNAATTGVAIAIAFVLFNTNRNDIVDIIEAREGRRIDSMIATTDNLASKLAVAGGTLFCAIALQNAGYDANLAAQPDSAINVINFMIGWAPAIASAIMFVAAFLLPIEKEYAKA